MAILRFLARAVGAVLVLIVLAIASIAGWWFLGDWQKRAERDIAFIHDTIAAHHPGPVDPENPDFRELMDKARAKAMSAAASVQNAQDHHAAVRTYTEVFQDGHLNLFFADEAIPSGGSSGAIRPQRSAEIEQQGAAYWITIGSFTEQRAPIAELTDEIAARAEELQAAELIVFDLRGNGGGNSYFGNQIAAALHTEEVYLDWVPSSAEAVDWRATAENARHVRGIARKQERNGRDASARSWLRIADGIAASAENGEDYYRQALSVRDITRTAQSPVQGQVVVLTDRRCASACLDFMDKMLALPGTLHIGEETSSDTQYIDVRFQPIASKSGVLILPLKVYRGRIRPSRGTYVPEVDVDPATQDLASVEALLASRTESDPITED